MRLALLALVLCVAGCAGPSRTLDNWLAAADVVSPEEAAEVFLEELEDRLDTADHELSDEQEDALFPIFVESTEERRAILERYRGATTDQEQAAMAEVAAQQARTDRRAEAILTAEQVPFYRQIMAEAAAWFQDELRRAEESQQPQSAPGR